MLDDNLRPTYLSPNGEEIVKINKDDDNHNNNEHTKKDSKMVR